MSGLIDAYYRFPPEHFISFFPIAFPSTDVLKSSLS